MPMLTKTEYYCKHQNARNHMFQFEIFDYCSDQVLRQKYADKIIEFANRKIHDECDFTIDVWENDYGQITIFVPDDAAALGVRLASDFDDVTGFASPSEIGYALENDPNKISKAQRLRDADSRNRALLWVTCEKQWRYTGKFTEDFPV